MMTRDSMIESIRCMLLQLFMESRYRLAKKIMTGIPLDFVGVDDDVLIGMFYILASCGCDPYPGDNLDVDAA